MKKYLFINYYCHPSEDRNAEYEFCLQKNASVFDKVFIMVESFIECIKRIDKIKQHGSCHVLVSPDNKRPTFQSFLNQIKREYFANSINVIANSDIFFETTNQLEQSMLSLDEENRNKIAFALSRWDWSPNKEPVLFNRPDSQDAWCFYGNKNIDNIKNVDFSLGIAGCDNRFAYELEAANYNVINPSKTIHTFHYHDTQLRTYINDNGTVKETIPPPYKLIPPSY
jgi:hypothetical protein